MAKADVDSFTLFSNISYNKKFKVSGKLSFLDGGWKTNGKSFLEAIF